MHCINTHFLRGCNFDEAYRNPCQSDELTLTNQRAKLDLMPEVNHFGDSNSDLDKPYQSDFNEEQQMKLRNIATRTGLLNFLMENSLLKYGPSRSMINSGNDYQPQERIIYYLLTSMVALTVILIIIVIVVLFNWTKLKLASGKQQKQIQQTSQLKNHYLSNQQQHSSRSRHHHHHRASRTSGLSGTTTGGKGLMNQVGAGIPRASSRRTSEAIDNSVL